MYYEDEEVKCSISRADSLPQENVDLKKLDEEDHVTKVRCSNL